MIFFHCKSYTCYLWYNLYRGRNFIASLQYCNRVLLRNSEKKSGFKFYSNNNCHGQINFRDAPNITSDLYLNPQPWSSFQKQRGKKRDRREPPYLKLGKVTSTMTALLLKAEFKEAEPSILKNMGRSIKN